jgi:uncharacterized repeat protein (TIGR02543 family)
VGAGSYALRAVAQDNQGATSTSTIANITVNSASSNYSLRFNGTNQQALFGNAIPALGRVFTVECCFYWERGTDTWQAILERQQWGQQEWGIIIGGPGSGYEGQVSGAFTYDGNHNNAIYIDWSTPLATGTWHHVALVGNNTQIYLYVDGVRRNTMSLTGNLGAVPSVQVSAASLMNPYEFFAGRIDEVRISNVARYTSDTYTYPLQAPFTADANTLALWHFDEGSGTTTADVSGNNHTGTTVNNPTWVSGYPFGGGVPNQPPSVTLTSPVNNSTYTAPATVNLAATASDSDGTIASVRFYSGTTLLNTATSSPYTYSWTGVGAGSYALRAVATDNQGATSTSTVVNITVYSSGTPVNQPPTVNLTSPVNGSTYTAPATVNLAATASDSDGTIASVRFYSGTTLLNTATSSPYTYSWTGVGAGSYALRAVAQDNQGATSTSTISNITVSAPVNQPPVVNLTSPVNGSTYTAPAGITLTATATDADGTIAAVRFYSGTTLLNLDNASPYTYTWMGVSSGTYQLYATATDNQGAVSTSAVANVTVYPPNQPPAVSLTSPVNNSTWTAPATIQLTASATDSDGSIANVRFYRGSTLLNTDSASPYEYTWTNVSSGTYQLRAVAQDNQGATSTSTIITVTVLSSSTPAVWYTLTATANPANGGTVTPASGTYLAGSQIQVTATPNANYTFATWSGDASGTNPTVTITMDSDKSITANFTYVPPANSSPTVSITSPQDGATYTAPASITITATATDSDGSIAAVRFYAGTTLLATDSTSPYSYTWTGVPAGSYILTVQAQDNQGAVGTSTAIGITVSAQAVYYTLTVSANPATGGTVALNPPPSGSGYLAGTQVAVTATPNAGYVFTGWSGNASGTNPTITLMMDGDKTVTAQFTPVTSNVTLTVTANPANAGTIALNPPGGSYVPGTAVTVTATPSQGYVFSGWSGGVVSTANPLNVTVTANMNLVANFITAPSTGTTPDVQPGTVRIVGGLDGYVNTAYENSVSVFFQPRRAGTVYIRVYSLNGRLVREGVVMSAMPGTVSSFSWDLRNNDGTAVSAGVYIVYVKGGGLEIKKKIVVLH